MVIMVMGMVMVIVMGISMDMNNIIGDKILAKKMRQNKQNFKGLLIEWLKDLEGLKNNINNLLNQNWIKKDGKL